MQNNEQESGDRHQVRTWAYTPSHHYFTASSINPFGRMYPDHLWLAPSPWASEMENSHPDQPQPLTFVLVHGSWADCTFWNGIAAELQNMGHMVYAPEYPGHGTDRNKNVTHAMISGSVTHFIRNNDLRNIILVGHSFGGTVIQKVAELIPERIKRLVFLNAFVLNDGQSLADELPLPTREAFQQLRKSSKDDTVMLPFPLFRENFANLGSLETVKCLYNRISPEPAKPLFEKLNLKKYFTLDIPKSYVHLTEDSALPHGSQDYGWFPHMANRLGMYRFIQGAGDHMTTVKTEPGRLARMLYAGARD
ncbi:alpha/beta hydrolase [Paenibacillus sp. sgz500958]|uniref:alpha/beta hydrolase n=1 Tax=Paenibacillus sp. sgz500958 TaxID=3242475 RepID=UPI0036D435AA